jgi:hypothetical protein
MVVVMRCILVGTLLLGACFGGGGDRADDPSIFAKHQATAADRAKAQEGLRHAVAQLEADTRMHRDSVRVVDQNVAVLLRDPTAMRRPAARDSVVMLRSVVDSLRQVNVTLARRRESVTARFDSMRSHSDLDRKVIANLTERLSTLEEMVAERDRTILALENRVDSLAESNRILADSNQRLVQLLADTTARLWQIIDSVSDGGPGTLPARASTAPPAPEPPHASTSRFPARPPVQGYVLILPLGQARGRGVLDAEYRIREDRMRQYAKPIDTERDTIIPLQYAVDKFGTPGRFDLPNLGPEVWTIDTERNALVIHNPHRFWGSSRYLVLVPLSRR